MRTKLIISTFIACWLSTGSMQAQLSSNPYKFFGNITTRGNVEAGGGVPSYYTLWNQITCENESKWSSVEGNRGNFNWSGAERAFNYAKQHNFTYKYHALVWGAQYPGWLESLSPKERYAAITNWFDNAKAKFNTLPMIDVVNEAVGMHQQGNPMMKESLGGGGKTGYDWLIRAFDMAYQRWPDAILIYNDYNSIQYDIDNYITLVQTLRDAGAPIDAYGNQSHELSGISETNLKNALKKQQDALQMPMFVTELDIDIANDTQQKSQYQKVLPVMWEAPYCAGVTLWGYVLGATWVDNSGLYRNGAERPAMTWIKEYMKTDAAKNAVGPFPGTKKEASVYIRPASMKVAAGDVLPIKIHAKLATKTIEKVDFYVNDELVKTMTEAPYVVEHTANKANWNTMKAVVTATDGSTYVRYGRFSVTKGTKRTPYSETIPTLPGTIIANEFDQGLAGVAYSSGVSRSNPMSPRDNQWMDYTVDVKEDGYYSFDAEIASANANGRFHLAEYGLDSLSYLTEFVEVPSTGSTSNFKMLHGKTTVPLTAGRHIISLMVEKGGFKLKNISFTHYKEGDGISIRQKSYSAEYGVGDYITLEAKISSKNSPVSEVKAYANNVLIGTMTASGTSGTTTTYTCDFVPEAMGTYAITTIATAEDGSEKTSAPRQLKVTSPTPTAIQTVKNMPADNHSNIYNLMGVKVGTKADWQRLPQGLYIVNGRKVTK